MSEMVINGFKQRIIGIILLIFLALIIFPWIFGKDRPELLEKKEHLEQKRDETAVISPRKNQFADIEHAIISSQHSITQNNIPNLAEQTAIIEKQATIPIANEEENHFENQHKMIRSIESNQLGQKFSVKQREPLRVELSKPDFLKIQSLAHATKDDSKLWLVQLGSFSNQENVSKLVKKLKAENYPVSLKSVKDKKVIQVLVGPLTTEREATIKQQLIAKALKINGIVVKK